MSSSLRACDSRVHRDHVVIGPDAPENRRVGFGPARPGPRSAGAHGHVM